MTTSPNEQFLIGGTLRAATATVQLDLPSTASSIAVSIRGTFVATLILEQSLNYGEDWQTIATVTTTSFTRYGVAAVTNFRVRCSAYTSGKAEVTLYASVASNSTSGGGGTTSDVNIVGINGTPPGVTNPVPVELTDGTNPLGTVSNPLNSKDASDGATAASVPATAGLQGLRAATAYPTAVTDGQLVAAMGDKAGRDVAVLNAPRDLIGTAIVSNNSTASGVSFIAAGATGVFNDIITFVATNRSATATVVTLTDGTASYTFALAANGGIVINFPTPLPATSSATAWTIGNSATVACDYVAVYAKNK